jgi:hypothetical protein
LLALSADKERKETMFEIDTNICEYFSFFCMLHYILYIEGLRLSSIVKDNSIWSNIFSCEMCVGIAGWRLIVLPRKKLAIYVIHTRPLLT